MCLNNAQYFLQFPQKGVLLWGVRIARFVDGEDEVCDGVCVGLHGRLQTATKSLKDGKSKVGGKGVRDDW